MVEFCRCILKIQNLLCEILGIQQGTRQNNPDPPYLKNSQKHNANEQKALMLMVMHGYVEVTSSGEENCLGKEKFLGDGELSQI